jgi:DNA repair protein RecO (recombination protein O)
MTARYKTKAIVFKKNNRNEADRSFSVFTKDFGRLDIFAKAIRKSASKLRGGIDIFFVSEIEFIQGKNKKTLTDAVIVEKPDNIFLDLEKFKIANKISEVVDNFIKGEERDENVFNLLCDVFDKLNSDKLNGKKSIFIYYYFLWNILSLLGYHQEVKNCTNCNEKLIPDNIHFSNKEGGVICKGCLGKDISAQKINADVVKILRIILSKDWETLSKLKIEESSQKLLEDISESAIRTFYPAYC